MRRPESWVLRYGIAVAAVGLAFLIKALFSLFISGESPFLLLEVAVLVAAVFGGLGPGVLATFLGGFIGDYFFLSPLGTLIPTTATHGLRTGLFVVQGLAISVVGASLISARRRTEEDQERVRASESRLAEAQRIARIGNWDYDTARDEAYWSDELYRIFGFEPQEFVPNYKTFLRLVHPGDRRILQEAIREAAGGAERSSVEYRIVRPDGEVRTVSTQYEPVMDGSGAMVRLIGTIQDVTERRRAEEALRESEERYRVVAETASDAIIVIDEEGRMSFVNEAAGRTFGYTADELLGEPLTMLMPERLRPLHRRAFERHLVTGERRLDWRLIELPGLHKSGREISLELSFGEFVRDGRRFFTGFIRDATERKRIEEELQISEERFRSIIEQAPLSVQVLSPDGRTLRVNRAWEELWGATFEELSAAGYNLLEDEQLIEKGIMPYIERGFSGEPTFIPPIMYDPDESVPEITANEFSQRWVSAFIYPVKDEAGNIREVTLIHEDITERVLAEEALRESEGRFRSTFEQAAVGVAHVGFGGEWLRVNEKLCEIVGYTREELLELTFQDITHPDDLQSDVESLHRLIAEEIGSYSREKRYLRKDGSFIWINLTVTIGEDAAGRQEYFISVIEDISDRKRYEQELSRLASYPLQSPDPIIEADAGGVPTYLNPAAEKLFPDLVSAGRAHPLLEGIEGADIEAHQANGESRETSAREVRVGERFYHRVISKLPQSGLLRIYATDITERRQAEEARMREEERFRSLIQYGSDIIVILAADGTVLYESPAIERVTGYRPEERVGRNAMELVHPEDREKLVEVLASFADAEAPEPVTVEYRSMVKDGSWHHFEAIGINLLRNPSVGGIVVNSRDITERKSYEEKLRRSEERYRAVIEQMVEGIVLFDPYTKRFVETNPAFREMFGYTAEELGRMKLYDIVTHDPESVDANVRRALRERQISVGARRYLRKDGALLDVEVSGSVISYEGEREVVSSVVRDVTERKSYEERLRRSEERYRAVIEQMVEGIFMFDPYTKRFVETNTAFEEMFGYTVHELQDMTLYDIVAHNSEDVDAYVRRCLEERYVYVGERRYRHKDGSLLEVEVSGSVIAYGEGREVVCAVVRDITERRRAEEALRHSEALYRAVVEQATENIFLVDAESGRLLEHNAALSTSLGYTVEELSRMTLYDLVAADRESVDRNIKHVLEQGSYFVGEREYRRKDGSMIPVEVGASVIYREGRQTLCVVAHDIEDRKQKEEAVREVRQAERSRIARELHDNVLQDIIYALQEAQILEEISEEEPALGEIAEALRRSVEGIRAAIFELRLEETLKESFSASVQNTVDLHRRMARRAHRIELEVADDFPRDLSREAGRGIIRIIQEALSNARRHSDAQLVTVSLRVEDGYALAEIADDGRGFDPETSQSGVGTHSTRQRAEELGGEISVESAPGSGTRVRLRIPYDRLVGK